MNINEIEVGKVYRLADDIADEIQNVFLPKGTFVKVVEVGKALCKVQTTGGRQFVVEAEQLAGA